MSESKIVSIGIVGAGTMGSGIAQVAAVAGHNVILHDVQEEFVSKSKQKLTQFLQRAADKGSILASVAQAAIDRVKTTCNLNLLGSCDLVIEAVFEDMLVKKTIFSQLDKMSAGKAILASNTSSLSITEIAKATTHPEQVAGMHFFNPVPMMPLVEIIRGQLSSEQTITTIFQLAKAWGKTPVHVKDTPGFIVNRVARPFYLETFRMLEEKMADIATIDAAIEKAGFRMGPGRLLDLIGLDVNYDVSKSVYEMFQRHPRFEPHPIQAEMVKEGRLGRKAGRGFYEYKESSKNEPSRPFTSPSSLSSLEMQIFHRILSNLVNEATYALQDEIATAKDIDMAMKLGTNYPKGPFEWAKESGLEMITSTLQELHLHSPRYSIAPLLWQKEKWMERTLYA